MEDNKNIFGIRMKKIRQEKGISLGELAELVGTTKSNLSKLELGKSKLPYTDLGWAIAKTLNVTLDYLLGITDNVKSVVPKSLLCKDNLEIAQIYSSLDPSYKRELLHYAKYLQETNNKKRR